MVGATIRTGRFAALLGSRPLFVTLASDVSRPSSLLTLPYLMTSKAAPKLKEINMVNAELVRALWHISPRFLTLFLFHAGAPLWFPFLFLLPVLALAALFDGARLFNPELGTLLGKMLPAGFLREHEMKGMSGTFWYLVGVELVLGAGALFCRRDDRVMAHTACISILYLAWADPAASFVGRRLGRLRPVWLHGKSIEGSAAAAAAGACITSTFLRLPYMSAAVLKGGIIAAFAEGVRIGGMDDNLVIPVMSAVLLRVCMTRAELLGA